MIFPYLYLKPHLGQVSSQFYPRQPPIKAGARWGMESNSYQISLNIKVNRADFFIDMFHLPVGWGQRRQRGHSDLLEVGETRPADLANLGR